MGNYLELYNIHKLDLGSNSYLIEAEYTLVLIDAGYPGKEKIVLSKVKSLEPKKLALIFLTHGHFDHYGSAQKIKEQTGALVGVHSLDSSAVVTGKTFLPHTKNGGAFGKALLPFVEYLYNNKGCAVDLLFRDNERLEPYGINAQIIHTPGHTPGSCSLILNNDIIFCGDLISTQFGIQKQKWYAFDWDGITQSVNKLKRLQPKIVYPGHGQRNINLQQLLRL